MKLLTIPCIALALALAAGAEAEVRFERPDCSAYKDAFKPERKCIRETRRRWQERNFAALQETGLMFIHMARPDIETSPAAREAIENEVEGSFAIRFSVATDGTVYNVRQEEVTDGIAPLAGLWADTIAQWTFTKIDTPVTDVEYRRIYLYSKEDDDKSPQERARAN
jgi:hypothetical protein